MCGINQQTVYIIRINIVITIRYIKHFYWIPLNLRVSSVVSPHSLSISSYLRSISPGMSLVALVCIFQDISMCFLKYGIHACIHILCEVKLLLYRGVRSNY